jgi:hypothetical protein
MLTSPQGGVFALGTSSHAYLEFDAAHGASALAGFRPIAGRASSTSRRQVTRPRRASEAV